MVWNIIGAAFQQRVLVVKCEVWLASGDSPGLAGQARAVACGISGVPFRDLRCLLGDTGKGDRDDTRIPPYTHTFIMIPRRIARPLGAFAKEWTSPSCVRLLSL
jgi:hypothetical protein